jgi:glyoxylase-like metal-dependent hydrolase (beta-lactamase superfamily II)
MATHFAGAALWAQEHVARAAADCEGRRRPWLPAGGLRCDRRLSDRERFSWREHSFTAHWMPGQTDAHAGYSARIDGRRVLFTGDNFYFPQTWGGSGGLSGFNGAWDAGAGYAVSARRVLEVEPEWLLMEHGMASACVPAWFECTIEWSERIALLQKVLCPERDRARHCNPYLIAFEPFVTAARAGTNTRIVVQLDNRGADRPRRAELTARAPAGISVRPGRIALAAEPDSIAAAPCDLLVDPGAELGEPLTLVPFAVTIDGVECGLRNAVFLDRRLAAG